MIEGATESAATAQALWDNLIGRGLDPSVCLLFIQRCQVHRRRRNIVERLPGCLQVSVKKALRQAWELGDAKKPSV